MDFYTLAYVESQAVTGQHGALSFCCHSFSIARSRCTGIAEMVLLIAIVIYWLFCFNCSIFLRTGVSRI